MAEPALAKIMCNEGDWHHSESPHPLVTLDFDAAGDLLAVIVLREQHLSPETGKPLYTIQGSLDAIDRLNKTIEVQLREIEGLQRELEARGV